MRQIDDVLDIVENIDDTLYACLDSIGGRRASCLHEDLSTENIHPPCHVFFSGCRAPHVDRLDKKEMSFNE
jgi:hypothetical protein